MLRHIVSSQQFDRPGLERLFTRTARIQDRFIKDPVYRRQLRGRLTDRSLIAFFYEPSTRTRTSFCMAAQHLGMGAVWTEDAGTFSSAAKGETLEDSIRVLCEYWPDVIVLRHNEDGAAQRAAEIVDRYGYRARIINAGDGRGQHPTQALLDLYTIQRERGKIDGATVVLGGDLANGRTARSLAYMLSKFKDVKLIFVAPRQFAMRPDILAHLDEHGVPWRRETDLAHALDAADIVYWTRIQTERIKGPRPPVNTGTFYRIGPEQMIWLRSYGRLLHPLPRVGEIDPEVDSDPRAAYFRQAGNGMFVRMALLLDLLEKR